MYPPYLAVAALLTVVTLFAVYRARSDRLVELGFAAILLLSLIAYPNTLFNTLPLMLPAIVVTLAMSDRLPFNAKWTVAVVVAQFGVVAGHGQLGFLSMMIGWTYLILCLLASPVVQDADPGSDLPQYGNEVFAVPHKSVHTSGLQACAYRTCLMREMGPNC